jgi:hypothetical protein
MTIKAAMLGTGYWARTAHLLALVAHPDATVVCADRNLDLALTAAETFGVPAAYDGLDSLLDNIAVTAGHRRPGRRSSHGNPRRFVPWRSRVAREAAGQGCPYRWRVQCTGLGHDLPTGGSEHGDGDVR